MGRAGHLTPQAFASRWRRSRLTERAASQSHFSDLCRMLGQPTPTEADPDGEFYTFERHVAKSGSSKGKGFADVWRRDHFAFEYKGKHRDLGAAYDQLLLYREDLENPPLLVVSDMEHYEVHTNFERTKKQVYAFTNDDIEKEKPEAIGTLRALFTNPDALRPGQTSEGVTEEAARKFARLADGLRGRGVKPERAAHFLNRLLFCLFAEDVGLLPKNLFSEVLQGTRRDPELFTRYVRDLFECMTSGGNFLLKPILRFNGGLFDDAEVVPLTVEEIRLVAEAARLDWSSVEPAIFGTLFERSLDPSQRARLGAHYTSREDILAIVRPVLMDPLRREWEQVKERAGAEGEKALSSSGRQAAGALRRAEGTLRAFAQKIREVRVLDPACGSGNFLYVALGELLDLEKEVSVFAEKVGVGSFFPEVSPEQLYGIETSPYAHELAQVVVWIGYLQWMADNGFGSPGEPVLGPMENILRMDAVLDYDESGRPVEPEWPEADVIVGNPPFLGGNRIRAELGGGYVDALFALYKGRVPAFADLVCYWFERARGQIEGGSTKRAGLLATQAIRGRTNRRVLERIKQMGDIFFAVSDQPWVPNETKVSKSERKDKAAVQVSMVGFDRGGQKEKTLDGAPVDTIYADLTGDLDLSTAQALEENRLIQFEGTKKGAAFDISCDVARRMLEVPVNPNGRLNSDVVRPWLNGRDVTGRPRGMWIVDFGASMNEEDAALYEMPFEYVVAHVKPKYAEKRKNWWLHERARKEMREALSGLSRYLVTTRHVKHVMFSWLGTNVLPDSALIAFARDDDYFFGVLHSQAHEVWARRMGTQLREAESGFRYTPTTCFETFAFPKPDAGQREAITEAARRLDGLRRSWLDPEGASESELKRRTLTNLYNARPVWLENAHRRLDEAVFVAYGWEADVTDENILKGLLALNAERAGQQSIEG